MPIYKRCDRCNKRLPAGTKCDCLKKRYKEYDKYSRDKLSESFYHSGEWITARSNALETDKGIDVYVYMTTGELVVADTVHHITPLKDDRTRRCDISNLISLAHDTHSIIESMYKQDKQKTMKMLYEMIGRYRSEVIS